MILQLPDADIGGFERQIEPLRQLQELRFSRLQFGNVAVALAEQQRSEEDRDDDDAPGGNDDQPQLRPIFRYRIPAIFRDGGELPFAAGEADLPADRILVVNAGRTEERRRRTGLAGRRADIPHRNRKMIEIGIALLVFAVARRHQPGRLVKDLPVDGDLHRAPDTPLAVFLDENRKEDGEGLPTVDADRTIETRQLVAWLSRHRLVCEKDLPHIAADPPAVRGLRIDIGDDEARRDGDMDESRVLDQQPPDLALRLLPVCGIADGSQVREIADHGEAHVDLCLHPGAQQVRLVLGADMKFAHMSGSIGLIEREADHDDDKGDKRRNQKRDAGILQNAPQLLAVAEAG